jgi:hypothetical protein
MGMVDETPEDVMHRVCDPELPDTREVWGDVEKSRDMARKIQQNK